MIIRISKGIRLAIMKLSKQSQRIAISFGVVLGLSLIMVSFDLSRMQIMQSKLDSIIKEHNVKSLLMGTMRNGLYERQIRLRNIMLLQDAFERDAAASSFNRDEVKVVTARNKFLKMTLSEKEKKLFQEIAFAMKIAYRAQAKLIEESIYNEDKEITQEVIKLAFAPQKQVMKKVTEMIALQTNATTKAVQDAEESYKEAKSSIYILGGSTLFLGIIVTILVLRVTESQDRDVKQAMSKIEESRHQLEERVQKRTVELALARDVALASNKAKDDFLANMSHELRTPLNIILGYSELLAEIAREEDGTEYIADLIKIQNAAHQQLELINSILDIAKIEEGQLDINPVDFDVERLLSEIDEATKPLMAKNNNTFKLNCMHGIGMMYSDNMRVRQILLNLLSNAAKFTKEGIVTLNVSKNESGDEIQFAVQDEGVGISENYMDDLFKKFTQADSTTTRKYGGTGLGLSISKQLSNQLNGDITVTSSEGSGSCFTLTLPIIYVA